MQNVDAGWDSYYFSKDAGGKLTFHPMWDYDLALGNNTEAKEFQMPKDWAFLT
ncbi:MAG: CotH kinase family protein [Ruminococcus callidus]